MEIKGKKLEGMFRRECQLNREAIDQDTRSVELAFSSEEPYERWFGLEVLGHDDHEVDLTRLKDRHPLLLQHDDNRHIGVIEKVWIGDDKRGRAVVRFAPSTNRLAEEVYQDVLAGIRGHVSVGYKVTQYRREEQLDSDGKVIDEKTVYRAVKWQPSEVSIVAVPADPTVGIGRSDEAVPALPRDEHTEKTETVSAVLTRKHTMADKIKDPETERVELEERLAKEKAESAARAEQEKKEFIKRQAKQRVEEIFAIAEKFDAHSLRDQAIQEDWSIEKFRQIIMDGMNPGNIRPIHHETETASEGKSIGELFVASPMYRELGARTGIRRNITFQLERPEFFQRVFSAGSEGLTSIQKLPGVPGLLDQQQLRLAQIIPQSMTSALTIRYIKEDAYTQPIESGTAESGTKPEATLDVSEVDATVRKIAVYVKVTDEMLADHEQMRGYIDGRLAYMIQSKEEDDLLNGTAAATEVVGIFQTTGINTLAASAYTKVADAFGQALNKVRTVGFVEPDAIVMHPNDWTDLILSTDSNGQYYAGGPFTGAYGVGGYSNVGRMFGLPVLQTTFCTEGTALIGAFRIGSQIFRRQGLTIEATNSEASDFINNRVTIRAEERLALAVYKPKAFCELTAIA